MNIHTAATRNMMYGIPTPVIWTGSHIAHMNTFDGKNPYVPTILKKVGMKKYFLFFFLVKKKFYSLNIKKMQLP